MTLLESSNQKMDGELKAIVRELETIRVSNESLLVSGQCYKQELEALRSHAQILNL